MPAPAPRLPRRFVARQLCLGLVVPLLWLPLFGAALLEQGDRLVSLGRAGELWARGLHTLRYLMNMALLFAVTYGVFLLSRHALRLLADARRGLPPATRPD